MSTIKNQRCFTEATASARLILATGLEWKLVKPQGFSEGDSLLPHHEAVYDGMISIL